MIKKLTPRQIEMRSLFRNAVLDQWPLYHGSASVIGPVIEVAKHFGISIEEACNEMVEIPSIGKIYVHQKLRAWLAENFRPVSDALFDGKSREQVLQLWQKTLRNVKPSRAQKNENNLKAMVRRADNSKLVELKMHQRTLDPWDRTNWHKVK